MMNKMMLGGALALTATAFCMTPLQAQTPPAAKTPAAPAPYTAPTPSAGEAPAPALTPSTVTVPDDDLTATARGLAPVIEDVQVVGPWTDGDKNGVWRTVMMQIPGGEDKYRFFVQQLQRGDKGLSAVATKEIGEIATLKGAVVGYRADEPSEGDESSLSLFFDVVPAEGEVAETYELHFAKDGVYTFGPASN